MPWEGHLCPGEIGRGATCCRKPCARPAERDEAFVRTALINEYGVSISLWTTAPVLRLIRTTCISLVAANAALVQPARQASTLYTPSLVPVSPPNLVRTDLVFLVTERACHASATAQGALSKWCERRATALASWKAGRL